MTATPEDFTYVWCNDFQHDDEWSVCWTDNRRGSPANVIVVSYLNGRLLASYQFSGGLPVPEDTLAVLGPMSQAMFLSR